MLASFDHVTVKCLLDDVLPKLKAVEDLANNTLSQLIAQATSDEVRQRHDLLHQDGMRIQLGVLAPRTCSRQVGARASCRYLLHEPAANDASIAQV